MTKGSGCCCSSCDTRLNCSQGDFAGGVNAINGGSQCCKCVPRRLCFRLDFQDYSYALQTVKIDKDEGAWFASFSIGSSVLTLRFEVIRDAEEICWVALTSPELGLVNDPVGYDDRLLQDLAGSFSDSYESAIRRQTCLNPEYEFDLDLTDFGEGATRLTISRASYVDRKKGSRNWRIDPYSCMCQCVCISIQHIDGSNYRQVVCSSAYNQWAAPFDPLDNQFVIVTRESEDGDPTVLSMESSIGDGEPVYAYCGGLTNMFAQWETSYGTVTVTCSGKGCTDCNCWCEDICIEYQDDTQRVSVLATWDEITNKWEADLDLEDSSYSIPIIVTKACNAETGQTELSINSPFGESDPISIECPEILAVWKFEKPETEEPISVTVKCATCGECQGPIAMEPCGCYDFIPETLYATFSPSADVPPDPPETPGQNAACTGAGGVIVMRALVAAGAVTGWTGCGYPFAGCPSLRVCLEMRCTTPAADASGLQLKIKYDDSVAHDIFPDEHACEPYLGIWKLINKDTTCCQSTGTVENLYDITITE